MYQALYRKYRPSTFENVVGQKVVLKTLQNALKNDQLSHAYIFSGPRGTGKTSIAKILAKAVNCLDKNNLICDNCVSCTQINNKQSSDIIEIDAASNNGIDEIREIRNKVNLVPTVGKFKIYIIDEVHMLTTGAFNALLKTLEEPPVHAIFILATTEQHKIPSTILSRCQKFEFKKISNNDMCSRIIEICKKEKINAEIEALKEIVRLSDGGLRDCISLLDQINSYCDGKIKIDDVHEVNGTINYKTILNFIKTILNGDIINLFKTLDGYYQSGKNIVKVSEEVLLYLRNILICKIDNSLIDNYDIYSDFEIVSKEDIIDLIDIINSNFNSIKDSSDPKLGLEILLLKYVDRSKMKYNITYNNYLINADENYTNERKIWDEENIKGKEDNTSAILVDNIEDNSNEAEENISKNTNEANVNEEKIDMKIDKSKEDINLHEGKMIQLRENEQIEEFNMKSEIKSQELNEKITVEIADKNDFIEALDLEEIMQEIKNIRITNTLAKFNKQFFLGFKSKVDVFKNYTTNQEYSFVADLIIDSELKAASDEYLVFVCDTMLQSETFNKNICAIEKLVLKALNREFKVVSTDCDSWDFIKKEFNEKTKIFEYKQEDLSLLKKIELQNKKEKNDLDIMYGSLVEYEEEK